MKAFADEDPALFLRLLGVLPADAEIVIEPIRPETAPSVVLPDYVAMLRIGPEGRKVILHVEFQTHYDSTLIRDMARYGGSLAWQYQVPVLSVLLLLRRDGVPVTIPEIAHYRIGDTETRHPFRVMRLWEIDPSPVLETKDVRLLPWALLMNSTDAQVRELAALVAQQGDDDAVSRFLIVGGIRYHRSALQQMLGGRSMGLLEIVWKESSVFAEAREELRAEGRVEGRVELARKLLCNRLTKRFPGLESLPEIEHICDVPTLEHLIEVAFESKDETEVRQAILDAAPKAN